MELSSVGTHLILPSVLILILFIGGFHGASSSVPPEDNINDRFLEFYDLLLKSNASPDTIAFVHCYAHPYGFLSNRSESYGKINGRQRRLMDNMAKWSKLKGRDYEEYPEMAVQGVFEELVKKDSTSACLAFAEIEYTGFLDHSGAQLFLGEHETFDSMTTELSISLVETLGKYIKDSVPGFFGMIKFSELINLPAKTLNYLYHHLIVDLEQTSTLMTMISDSVPIDWDNDSTTMTALLVKTFIKYICSVGDGWDGWGECMAVRLLPSLLLSVSLSHWRLANSDFSFPATEDDQFKSLWEPHIAKILKLAAEYEYCEFVNDIGLKKNVFKTLQQFPKAVVSNLLNFEPGLVSFLVKLANSSDIYLEFIKCYDNRLNNGVENIKLVPLIVDTILAHIMKFFVDSSDLSHYFCYVKGWQLHLARIRKSPDYAPDEVEEVEGLVLDKIVSCSTAEDNRSLLLNPAVFKKLLEKLFRNQQKDSMRDACLLLSLGMGIDPKLICDRFLKLKPFTSLAVAYIYIGLLSA